MTPIHKDDESELSAVAGAPNDLAPSSLWETTRTSIIADSSRRRPSGAPPGTTNAEAQATAELFGDQALDGGNKEGVVAEDEANIGNRNNQGEESGSSTAAAAFVDGFANGLVDEIATNTGQATSPECRTTRIDNDGDDPLRFSYVLLAEEMSSQRRREKRCDELSYARSSSRKNERDVLALPDMEHDAATAAAAAATGAAAAAATTTPACAYVVGTLNDLLAPSSSREHGGGETTTRRTSMPKDSTRFCLPGGNLWTLEHLGFHDDEDEDCCDWDASDNVDEEEVHASVMPQ